MTIAERIKPRNSRICYDKHFRVSKGNEFEHRGRKVDGISLSFVYMYFVYLKRRKEEVEILFPEDGSIQPDCFYSCSYDMTDGYEMKLNERQLKDSLYSNVEFKPDREAFIFYSDSNTSEPITFIEAVKLLKNNPQAFNNSNNVITQSVAYSMAKV